MRRQCSNAAPQEFGRCRSKAWPIFLGFRNGIRQSQPTKPMKKTKSITKSGGNYHHLRSTLPVTSAQSERYEQRKQQAAQGEKELALLQVWRDCLASGCRCGGNWCGKKCTAYKKCKFCGTISTRVQQGRLQEEAAGAGSDGRGVHPALRGRPRPPPRQLHPRLQLHEGLRWLFQSAGDPQWNAPGPQFAVPRH